MMGTLESLIGYPVAVYIAEQSINPEDKAPNVIVGIVSSVDHRDSFISMQIKPGGDHARLARILDVASTTLEVHICYRYITMIIPIPKEEYETALRSGHN